MMNTEVFMNQLGVALDNTFLEKKWDLVINKQCKGYNESIRRCNSFLRILITYLPKPIHLDSFSFF